MAFTVPRNDCTEGESGSGCDRAVLEAAGTPLHTDDANSDGPPSTLCRTSVTLRLIAVLARLPVPDALGFPLVSSEADAAPHATFTLIRLVAIGTGQALDPVDPVGVAVTPSAWATASCVLDDARPDSEADALVGHGFVEDAVERHAPVPEASATGTLLAPASEPPPANCNRLSRSSDTNPPFDCTFHWPVCAPAPEAAAHSAITAMSPTTAILIRPLICIP